MSRAPTSWRILTARFARLGVLGFGGPPAHVVMMRRQWVDSGDVDAAEFNDAFAAVSLLPGPASTQLAMWLGWRLRGWRGLLIAAALFVVPAVAMVLVLSSLVLGPRHPRWLSGAALGAAAIVPAVALRAAIDIGRGYDWRAPRVRLARLAGYVALGALACFVYPSGLPVAMVAAGALELALVARESRLALVAAGSGATKAALSWTALKVGALSFGGGFVIVPIMRGDAVNVHHWMTASTFVTAVAIGQVTPGPVVATVAAVGYSAAGWAGGVMAAAIAFAPSVLFVGLGARHLGALRERPGPRTFLAGAGPAATGAIAAASVILALGCTRAWQWPLLAAGLVVVVLWRRAPTVALLAGGAVGLVLALATNVSV
jgi:chromate transporter